MCEDVPMCTEKVPIPAHGAEYENNVKKTGKNQEKLEKLISNTGDGTCYIVTGEEKGLTVNINANIGLTQDINIVIPGLEEPYLGCGEIYKIKKCPGCDYKSPIRNSCDRAKCSECWESWASREANRCADRIVGYKGAYKAKRNKRLGNVKNIYLSPPQEMAVEVVNEPGGVNKLKKKAIEIAKKYNLYGGLLDYHHHRVKKEYIEPLEGLERKTKRKKWDLIREDELGLGSWEAYVYTSPHYHLKVYGVKVNSKKFYEETGWILKFKRHISTRKELSRVIFYELSHVAIREGRRAVTWFGSLSYNKLSKKEESVVYDVCKCPNCGGDLTLEDLRTGICEVAVAKVITYIYRINDPPRLKVQILLEVLDR